MNELPSNLDTILHIGAGSGEELAAYLESDAKRILLVEPNPNLAESLGQRTQGDHRAQVIDRAITDNPALNELVEYNLPEAASLYQPAKLRQLYPGLRIIGQYLVATEKPEALMGRCSIKEGVNLLVIQAPGAEMAIISSLANAKLLESWSYIWLTAPEEVYYEGGSGAERVIGELHRWGFELAAESGKQNPDWPQWLLTCSPLTRKLRAEREQAEAKSIELAEHLNSARQRLEASESARQHMEAAQQEAEHRISQLSRQVKKLEEQLTSATKDQQLMKLQKRMEYLFDQQGLQLEQAANALGRHVSSSARSTVKELEAGFQLQQQLGADFATLAERGNRLPSTVALELSRRIRTQPYDLIIEMGSGITTSFLAHTLRHRGNREEGEASGKDVARFVEPSDGDLPKRILCLEHNRATLNQLQTTLAQSGLAHIVTLQYAPLVSYHHKGNEYLYYDCASRLRQIAQLFESRTARILVLLNEVSAESRPDHLVALPQLLQYLSAHSLEIVANSNEIEKGTLELWGEMLVERGLEYINEDPFESSNFKILRINP